MIANLAEVIARRFPDKVSSVDWSVQDDSDGEGPYIGRWKRSMGVPRPDSETLAQWWSEDAAIVTKQTADTRRRKELLTAAAVKVQQRASAGDEMALMMLGLYQIPIPLSDDLGRSTK